jgi:N-methylhydantoinase A/oxoprolinase/acetone carboxylase beta subunit
VKIGLGIDAGGTYTDAVIYDHEQRELLCKGKALTTKWDFTKGIQAALSKLDPYRLKQVGLVSLSTTLATNAIVEGEGQRVGMLIMPPYGRLDKEEISYEPKALLHGQLQIDGKEIEPVDPSEVRQIAGRMVRENGVKAFAVSGFAGAVNPDHEYKVKRLVQDETGLLVTCGHELSRILNFKTRAYTAMLNARIVPKLVRLVRDLERVLQRLEIVAPVMVVKGDGSLMHAAVAMERPVETILSGPAASVAGARHLTGLKTAIVVDMGGTTTDTALLVNGAVDICENGAIVGGHRTHVKALAIRTSGLGGDSLIQWRERQFVIGPQRVAPIAWLGAVHPDTKRALDVLDAHLDPVSASTDDLQVLALTGIVSETDLTPREIDVLKLLQSRPRSIGELAYQTGVLSSANLPLDRLEAAHALQRCGLTLTDLLHVTGRFVQWDRASAEIYCRIFSRLTRLSIQEMAEASFRIGVERLTMEVLKRQLDSEIDGDLIGDCPACGALMANMLAGGNDQYRVRLDLKRPLVGIGAPIHFFLPRMAKVIGVETILPEHADVANAVGAIAADVMVEEELRIVPDRKEGFLIDGLPGARRFGQLDEADRYAKKALIRMVRKRARSAGTSEKSVTLQTKDDIAPVAAGVNLLIRRSVLARLSGQPDPSILAPAAAKIRRDGCANLLSKS